MTDSRSETKAKNLRGQLLTIPTLLCAIRFVGSPFLLVLAAYDRPGWTLAVYLFLASTDWVDGKIAIWLNQCSPLGARLDTIADLTMYASLLAACVWLRGGVLAAESAWFVVAILTYMFSCLASLFKFRKLPSYHTRSAKATWFLVVIATISLLVDGPVWLLRIAMIGATVANLESLLITMTLPSWETDVISWQAARRIRMSRENAES